MKFSYICNQYLRLVKWMKYNPPYALSIEHWASFNDEYKKHAPVRYFITHTLPEAIFPIHYYFTFVHDWIRYRTYNRYNIVDTGLSPGYYEISEKMLHGPFNLLKDFVEKERAWASDRTLTRKERLPFYYEFFYRKPATGIKHLEWECTLDDVLLPAHEQCIHQAVAAREILALYVWWTMTRHQRTTSGPDMYDFQGYDLGPLDGRFNAEAEDYKQYREWDSAREDLEEQWKAEDSEMLIRLIKIRDSLWT